MRDLTNTNFMGQGVINPFSDDLFIDHPDNLPGVTQIHRQTFDRIVEAVEDLVVQPECNTPADMIGRTILVTAPEAGYGKTHLATRLRDHLKSAATAVSLSLDPSRPVAWPGALGSTIRQFSHLPSARYEGRSLFEETGRHLLAQLVISHLAKGTTWDCAESEESLRQNFIDLFSNDSPSSLLNWTDSKSRELSHDVDPLFLRSLGLTSTELGFWIRLIIDFNWRGDTALEPLRGLSNGEARERLLQWLRLASFYRPVLIVADGLDGFFQSETAGMEIAGILTGIRETVPRSVSLVCINNDVWESIFQDKLPSAWLDRLTGEPHKLRPVSPEAAAQLIQERLDRTPISSTAAQQFVERLKTDHLWIDAETKLSPRSVIRQARDLWDREAQDFLNPGNELAAIDTSPDEEEPLAAPTEKVDFFKPLQEDRPHVPLPPLPRGMPPTPEPEKAAPRNPIPLSPPPEIPPVGVPSYSSGETVSEPVSESVNEHPDVPENPFFTLPPKQNVDHLAGIASIISDIRDSGKTVVSESAEGSGIEFTPEPVPPLPVPAEPFTSFQAGDLFLKPAGSNVSEDSSPVEKLPSIIAFPTSITVDEPIEAEPVVTRPGPITRSRVEDLLKEREQEILDAGPVLLKLEEVERFVQKMGAHHLGLKQTEERYPSSRTTCLRWNVRGQSVLIGFESPRNVYFWNNLLQQSLSSNRHEKITAFSHSSEAFDPGLFASFGFSPSVIRGRIDTIEMSDQELALVYASDSILDELEHSPGSETAAQFIAMNLDPLWRRISRSL